MRSRLPAFADFHSPRATDSIESFNQMVSHELRQPLGTLMYAIPLMRADVTRVDSARQDHQLAVMNRNVRRLTQLMEQMEVLSRLRTRGADMPHIQLTEVSVTSREVARQLRDMAEARSVEVHVHQSLEKARHFSCPFRVNRVKATPA